MIDVLRALATAAGLLLPVIILSVIVSMLAVNRGEAAMHPGALAPEVLNPTETNTSK